MILWSPPVFSVPTFVKVEENIGIKELEYYFNLLFLSSNLTALAFQPRLLQPPRPHPQVQPEPLPAMLQGVRQRHRLQEAKLK